MHGDAARLTFSDKLTEPVMVRWHFFCLAGKGFGVREHKKAASDAVDARTANSIVDWHSEKANYTVPLCTMHVYDFTKAL